MSQGRSTPWPAVAVTALLRSVITQPHEVALCQPVSITSPADIPEPISPDSHQRITVELHNVTCRPAFPCKEKSSVLSLIPQPAPVGRFGQRQSGGGRPGAGHDSGCEPPGADRLVDQPGARNFFLKCFWPHLSFFWKRKGSQAKPHVLCSEAWGTASCRGSPALGTHGAPPRTGHPLLS
jgi:hypothetical protein